jgi:hypothetical protein
MVWILAFSAAGWLLRPFRNTEERWGPYPCFWLIGMLCAFFDLFTVPLITLTVPLLGLYWKGEFDSEGRKLSVCDIFVLSVLWLAGYAVCWAAKWVILGALGGTKVVSEISYIIQHRIGFGSGPLGDGGRELSVSLSGSILANARACWYGWLIVIGFVIARMHPIAAAVRSNKKWNFAAFSVPLVLLSMPIAWLAIVEQHSISHAWFVARIYFTSFAIILAAILAPRDRSGDRAYAKVSVLS